MTCSYEVKPSWKPALRYLSSVSHMPARKSYHQEKTYPRCINDSACDIEEAHEGHPLNTQTPLLDCKPVKEDAMQDEQNRREAETCVHQRSILAKCGSQKRRMESEQYASACTCRYLNFVSLGSELLSSQAPVLVVESLTKHQCMIFIIGSHAKAKCIDGRLAPHISNTIPPKSSRSYEQACKLFCRWSPVLRKTYHAEHAKHKATPIK
jgi:hypothetical protein